MTLPHNLPAFTRQQFAQAGGRRLSRNSPLKPQVWEVEMQGMRWIVKDVAALSPRWRPLARYLLRRERRALRRLAGVARVPQWAGDLDKNAFLCSFLPGTPLTKEQFRENPRVFADALTHIGQAIHQRGVFHLDLRQRQNIFVDADGLPQVVDFGASLILGPLSGFFFRRLFSWVDDQASLKYLSRWAPDEMTLEEAKSFLRGQRWRRLWFVSSHHDDGEHAAAKRQAEK